MLGAKGTNKSVIIHDPLIYSTKLNIKLQYVTKF